MEHDLALSRLFRPLEQRDIYLLTYILTCMASHYILLGCFLFFDRRPRRSPNGTRPNFVTCSEVGQIWKCSSKTWEFPPKTWGQTLPIVGWIYEDIATRRKRERAALISQRYCPALHSCQFETYVVMINVQMHFLKNVYEHVFILKCTNIITFKYYNYGVKCTFFLS